MQPVTIQSRYERIIRNIIRVALSRAADTGATRLRIVSTNDWFPLRFPPGENGDGEIIIPDLPRAQAVGHVLDTLKAMGAVVVDDSLGARAS